MTGSPFAWATSISDLMYSRATQLSSPQEVRHRLIDSRMGSGRSPQNAQLTSITSSAGRLPNPARAPNPPAANTALSRSVRNLSQIRSGIEVPPLFITGCLPARSALLRQCSSWPQRAHRTHVLSAGHSEVQLDDGPTTVPAPLIHHQVSNLSGRGQR